MGLLDRWIKKQETNKKPPVKFAKSAKINKIKDNAKEMAAETDVKTDEVKTETSEKNISLLAEKIIIKPIVTEKTAVMESLNKYGFIVARQATKEQIKMAVNELYGIKPIAVNVINVQGKIVRSGRQNGRRPDFKKAFVTLPAGKSITIHEGV